MRTGANDLEILLSDGWYRGSVGTWRKRDSRGTATAARLELHVTYADGTRAVFGTGEDWTSRRSRIVATDLMNGQTTDFTAVPEPAKPVLVDAVTAPPVSWSPAPPVRQVEQLAPRSVNGLGGLQIWVNNAGIFPSVPVLDMPDETWERVFAVNARGAFLARRRGAWRRPTPGASS